MIFRLSSVLGGRSEVIEAPFFELLAHLDMLQEKEKSDHFVAYLNMFYANPMTDQKARSDYIKEIQPESELLQQASEGGGLVTNLDQLRLLKQLGKQEANAAQLKGG